MNLFWELQELGFKTLQEYFEYIVESRINGQHKQARELFKRLSEGMQGQRVEFFRWLEESYYYEGLDSGEQVDLLEWKFYLNLR